MPRRANVDDLIAQPVGFFEEGGEEPHQNLFKEEPLKGRTEAPKPKRSRERTDDEESDEEADRPETTRAKLEELLEAVTNLDAKHEAYVQKQLEEKQAAEKRKLEKQEEKKQRLKELQDERDSWRQKAKEELEALIRDEKKGMKNEQRQAMDRIAGLGMLRF